MKTTNLLKTLALLILSGSLMLTSCKKKDPESNEDGQASADNRTAQSENDIAINDVNQVISENTLLHGKTNGSYSLNNVLGNICGLSIDTAGIHQGTVKLNYNGTSCNNRTRTGSIRLTIQSYTTGVRWKDSAAVLKVDYLAYKITRTSDGKSVEINGTQYLTNVSGGTWFDLFFLGQTSLSHQVTGTNLNVTFDGVKTAVYNINRRFTYTLPGNILTCKGEGIGTDGVKSNLENYGYTRDGDYFTSQVAGPIIWNLTCGGGAPIQGEVNIAVSGKSFDLNCLFGVDNGGTPVVVGNNQCPYGMKVSWTYNSKNYTKVIGYW